MAGKRGRPRKNPLPEQISEQEVYDVLEFAKSMVSGLYPNVYTPDLVNSRMKDLTLNPLVANEDNVQKALQKPKENEENLKAIGEYFEMTDMLYKRSLNYFGNMLSFDLTWVCTNTKKKSEYKSAAYKKDLNIVYDFLDRFDYKFEFKKAIRQMIRQDSYFTAFRDEGERYSVQELPSKYCKISGKSRDYACYLFDFNMMYFISNPGVDIRMYPQSFWKYYTRVMTARNENNYIPSNSMNDRMGNWVYWVQTGIEDNVWCFKYNMEQATQIPFLTPMFCDVVETPLVRQLQKNKYIIQASRLLVGLVPMLKEGKSGNVKDMLGLDPTTLGKFASLIKQGLPDPIGFGVAPFSNVEEFDFQKGTDINIYNAHNTNVGVTTGSRLIYPSASQNAVESNASLNVDEMMVANLYSQFNQFMNYQINKRTKNYKFNFTFEGFEFDSDRQNRFDKAMSLADKGVVLPQLIASAIGKKPQDLDRMMDEADATEWTKKLMPMLNIYNQSKGENTGGRPQKKANELSDSGLATRQAGSNIEKGGNV